MKLKSHKNPPQKKWQQILSASATAEAPTSRLPEMLRDVERDGDPALRRIVKETRGRAPRRWMVDKRTIAKMQKRLDEESRSRLKALKTALEQVHHDQLPDPVYVRTAEGIDCHRQPVPIRSIGICLGHDAATNAASMMMVAVPARLAGCESISVCVPADAEGKLPSDVMCAASLCGIDNVYALGGEEAVAALATGTATIQRVDKLFVLGVSSVATLASCLASRVQCLALTSAPSRILIIADDTTAAASVATAMVDCASRCAGADLLLVCASSRYAAKVERALDKALQQMPVSADAKKAIADTRLVVFEGEDFRLNALDFANMCAPDQLLLMVQEPAELAEGVYAARLVQCGGGISMAQRMACGVNTLADASARPDVAGSLGMDDFMHRIDFITT